MKKNYWIKQFKKESALSKYVRYTGTAILLVVIGFGTGYGIFHEPEPELVIPEGYESLEEYVVAKTRENLDLGAVRPAGLFTYRLSGSGISSSATSFNLNSLTLPQNDYPVQDSDLSDTFYLTFEPGSTARQEFVSCTTIGSNTGGAVTISGCTRGLSPITPYTASSTLQFAHPGGSAVIFSDPPQLFNQFAAKTNEETIERIWTFDVLPTASSTISSTATTTYQFTTKEYVDNTTNQGAATSSESVGGISELATALETASTTDLGANQPLVLQAKYATSTPGSTCHSALSSSAGALCTVIATLSGKISQLWLDLTEAFTWLGAHIFEGDFKVDGSTATSTRSIWIGSGGVADQIDLVGGDLYVQNDVEIDGSLCVDNDCVTSVSDAIATSTEDFFTENTTSEFNVASVSIPADTLGTTDGKGIRMRANVSTQWQNGTDNVTFRLKYGGTTMLTFPNIISPSGAAVTASGTIEFLLLSKGSASSQEGSGFLVFGSGVDGSNNLIKYRNGTASEDSTGALDMIITAQFSGASTSNQVDTFNVIVEKLR